MTLIIAGGAVAYGLALALVLAFNYGAHRNERCERHQEQAEVTR